MDIKQKACGAYETNCYIVKLKDKELIIDPGVGAYDWIKDTISNPVAILNTHGHFDHVWDNDKISKEYDIPIYCPKDDIFMLKNGPFNQGTPPSEAIGVEDGDILEFESIKVIFTKYSGHTPATSTILINNNLFSGDFVFKDSIGRYDLPYSDANAMQKSIERFIKLEQNYNIYPGHGATSNLKDIQNMLKYYQLLS